MAKVLQRLARRGLVTSHQGTRGGYRLARGASVISVADIIQAIDGPLTVTACSTEAENCEQLQQMQRPRSAVAHQGSHPFSACDVLAAGSGGRATSRGPTDPDGADPLAATIIAEIMSPIYLDFHATTPVDPRVLEAMLPYFTEQFGNAASKQHAYGWDAQKAVDARAQPSPATIGASPSEIVFTSGASESNNLAIKGIVRRPARSRRSHHHRRHRA
jgi:hypothetical protein